MCYTRITTKAGFSLIEVMFSLAILLIVSGGLLSVFAAGDDTWQVNRTRIGLQQEARRAMENMIYDLRHASSSSVVNVLADGTPFTSITFRKPNNVTNGTLQWNGVDTVIGLSGTNLQKTEGNTVQVLARDVSAVTFTRTSTAPDILLVSLTTQRSTNEGLAVDYTLNFDVQLRN